MKQIIATKDAPAAIGPYSQAIAINGFLFVSGQIPINPATQAMASTIEEQTRQVMENINAIIKEAGYCFNDIVKTTVLLSDINEFNAVNAIYAEYFPEDKPARACFQVAALPKGAKIEVEVIAAKE